MELEIDRLCDKLNANNKIRFKAKKYLTVLNNKVGESMGKDDMLKYLILINIAFIESNETWNINVANRLGLKLKTYPTVFAKIYNILGLQCVFILDFFILLYKYNYIYICLNVGKQYHLKI